MKELFSLEQGKRHSNTEQLASYVQLGNLVSIRQQSQFWMTSMSSSVKDEGLHYKLQTIDNWSKYCNKYKEAQCIISIFGNLTPTCDPTLNKNISSCNIPLPWYKFSTSAKYWIKALLTLCYLEFEFAHGSSSCSAPKHDNMFRIHVLREKV